MTIRCAVLLSVLLALPVTARAQAQNDHLKCYQVKDPLNLAAVVDLNSPQFGLEAGCKVSKANFFCVPAAKTVASAEDKKTHVPITPLPVSGPDPGDRICYKVKCPVPLVPIADQSVTDQFGNRTVTKFKASYLCTPAVKGTYQRFVDNGDGTVTDNQTGLQWEQKVSPGGGATDPHDVDNVYDWGDLGGCPFPGCPNGAAFTDFLGRLNNCVSQDPNTMTVTGGFAGRCDWRLPTIAELQTILLAPFLCNTSPCIDAIFGPTAASTYWSSTTLVTAGGFLTTSHAWLVDFNTGAVGNNAKLFPHSARAVRGGL